MLHPCYAGNRCTQPRQSLDHLSQVTAHRRHDTKEPCLSYIMALSLPATRATDPKKNYGHICTTRSWNSTRSPTTEGQMLHLCLLQHGMQDRYYIYSGLHLVCLDRCCICFGYYGCWTLLVCHCSSDAASSLVHLLTAPINTSVTANIIKFAVDTCALAYLDAL